MCSHNTLLKSSIAFIVELYDLRCTATDPVPCVRGHCWWGQAYRLTILYPSHYLNNLFLTISLCKNHLFSLDQVPYQVKTLKDNMQELLHAVEVCSDTTSGIVATIHL